MIREFKNNNNLSTKASFLAIAVCCLLSSEAAMAQTEAKADTKGLAGSDIIVTAQRRKQTAIKTPISLTAIDGNSLRDNKIEGLSDLETISPGIRSAQQTGVNRLFIRGIGLNSFASGADPSVAFYVDGVYVGRPTAQLSSFFDLDRIEVLRGPQGALYGRNATGGAVNLITAEPTRTTGGYLNLSGGNYGLVEGEGAINLPLSANGDWRMRTAVHLLSHDGYGYDVTAKHAVNDAHDQDVRSTLQYNPSSAVDIKLIGEYHHELDNNNYTSSFGAYPGYVLQGVAGTVDPNNNPLQGIAVINSQNAATDLPGYTNRREGYALTLNGKFEIAENLSLTSITGWRKFDRYNASDSDGTSAGLGNTFYTENSNQISQEFDLNYSTRNLVVTAGVSYYHEKITNHVFVPFVQYGAQYIQDGYMNIDAFSGFAQATYSVTPSLRLTAAGRYSTEKRNEVGTFTFAAPPVDTSGEATFNKFNPTFRVEYDLAPKVLVYASAVNGFKSGTYNIGQVNPVIEPETIWSYEAGIKARALDNNLEVTAAYFHYDYSNLQVGKVIGIATVTTNAASAKTDGAELTIKAKPTSQLTIDTNLTYLISKFSSFCSVNPLYQSGTGVAPGAPACDGLTPQTTGQNLSGHQLPGAPRFSATLGLQYEIPLQDDAKLIAHADAVYTSRIYFDEFNDVNTSQARVVKTNLSLKYDSGKAWTVSIWGKNVTNQLVAANKLITIQLWGYPIYGAVEPPATFGGTLGLKF